MQNEQWEKEINEPLLIPGVKSPHGFTLIFLVVFSFLSFLPEDDFSYQVKMFTDERGWLFELIKSTHFGQIFVFKTLPGITRGDHYHDTKLEKFCVIRGLGFSLLEAASIFGRHGYQKVILVLYG